MTLEAITALNELAKQTHRIQYENGWWNARLALMKHNSGEEYVKIAVVGLAMTELAEAIEAVRKNRYGMDKDSFERELAGTIVRVLDIAGALDIDIGKAFALELEACKQRGKMHGGNKA